MNDATINTTSLRDFYAALGQSLPEFPERAQLYEEAGFGSRGTYIATAEQNNRLLGWLKRRQN